MNERFYLVKITWNKVAQAEDRVVNGYNSLDEAEKAFHSHMTQSILGETIGWTYACVMDGKGSRYFEERWDEKVQEVTE